VEDLHIPARDGHAHARAAVRPERGARALPLLLYLHGGGFTIGSIATHDVLCRELARLSGCMVVSLDYRLAPEHRFPTASNDAWDALAWLAQHAATLGADPPGWPWAATARAAPWRQSTPSWRAMRACRWRCSC
jgi:acetyl esterase